MNMKNLLLFLFGVLSALFISCGDDNTTGDTNNSPEVFSEIADLSLLEGFAAEEINLSEFFTDQDQDNLTYTATNSNQSVLTVAISGSTLTLTEVGLGIATIDVTANDGKEGSVSDDFAVTIAVCPNDNSTNQDNTSCTNSTPMNANQYTETLNVGMTLRTITTNRVPNHDYGNQLTNLGVMELESSEVTYTFTAEPELASATTSILTSQNRPAYDYGIALNGVPIDPAPAEPFIFEDSSTGEYNWDWVFEPTNNMNAVGLDCNAAHLQPVSGSNKGLIHYHGDMEVYADELLAGLGTGTTEPTSPVQVGWAIDGFPIVYKYGPDGSGGVEALTSSYVLKSGFRSGDGVSEPCGEYSGKYTNDYEFVVGSGDLDECNGISRNISLATPAGETETFSYFYVITSEFPIIGRCLSGTPDEDFSKGMGGM